MIFKFELFFQVFHLNLSDFFLDSFLDVYIFLSEIGEFDFCYTKLLSSFFKKLFKKSFLLLLVNDIHFLFFKNYQEAIYSFFQLLNGAIFISIGFFQIGCIVCERFEFISNFLPLVLQLLHLVFYVFTNVFRLE